MPRLAKIVLLLLFLSITTGVVLSVLHSREGSSNFFPSRAISPAARSNSYKNAESSTQLSATAAVERLQSLRAELRKRLTRLREQGNLTLDSGFPLSSQPALAQEKASTPGKIDPILLRPPLDTPSKTSPSSYPRYDVEGRVLVQIQYDPGSLSRDLIENMVVESDGRVYAHIPREGILEAYLPQASLEGWSAYDWVKIIKPVGPAIARVGSITTEGDSLLGAEAVRQQFGINGSGVKVGVISDGVDHLDQAQSSGDLPPTVIVLANATGGDEGTAMLEIIHDLAPGAELYFHDGGSATRFRMAVDAFRSNDCDIIVDDIAYFTEPIFEDGLVAQAVADAVADGTVFVSAAGNYAEKHAEMDWSSTHTDPSKVNLNEWLFGKPALVFPDDKEEIVFELGPFNVAEVYLHWSERFGEASHDYDIVVYYEVDYLSYLIDLIVWYDWVIYGYYDWLVWGYWYDSLGYIHYGQPRYPIQPTPVSFSRKIQNGSGDPLEVVSVSNSSLTWVSYMMVVEGWSSPSTSDRLEMIFYHRYITAINLPGSAGTPVGSIFGHPAVEGVLAVGAINATDPELDDIEPFSSQGPSYVPFSTTPLRSKPDLCAVDNVAVTGVGGFGSPFTGTSAAAPHVAAIAALVKESYPSLSGEAITSLLKDSAVDLGSPGHDSIFGYGRVDVQSAIDSDADSMEDSWELHYFGSLHRDGTLDWDADDLSDIAEYENGCNPIDSDTDGDGMPDGWEAKYGLNLLANDASADKDKDGRTNLQEYQSETDPTDPTDPDDPFPWELFYPAFMKKK